VISREIRSQIRYQRYTTINYFRKYIFNAIPERKIIVDEKRYGRARSTIDVPVHGRRCRRTRHGRKRRSGRRFNRKTFFIFIASVHYSDVRRVIVANVFRVRRRIIRQRSVIAIEIVALDDYHDCPGTNHYAIVVNNGRDTTRATNRRRESV